MKTCPYCAEAIQEDAQFCQFCGTNLTTTTPTVPLTTGAIAAEDVTSGKAVASLICGIFFFILPAAIVAIILGHLSYSEIGRSLGRIRGKGMALAGLILGYFGVAFVPFILIIAAIAIPNLLRAKMAANESSAVGALRTYNTAIVSYENMCPKVGFPPALLNLGPGPSDCDRAGLVDPLLGASNPTRSGYSFHYEVAQPTGPGEQAGYTIAADPITQGTTGARHFFTDKSGVIRYNNAGPADASSPPLR